MRVRAKIQQLLFHLKMPFSKAPPLDGGGIEVGVMVEKPTTFAFQPSL